MKIRLRAHMEDGKIAGVITGVTNTSTCCEIIDYEWQEIHKDGQGAKKTHTCRWDIFFEQPFVIFEQATFLKG